MAVIMKPLQILEDKKNLKTTIRGKQINLINDFTDVKSFKRSCQ